MFLFAEGVCERIELSLARLVPNGRERESFSVSTGTWL